MFISWNYWYYTEINRLSQTNCFKNKSMNLVAEGHLAMQIDIIKSEMQFVDG